LTLLVVMPKLFANIALRGATGAAAPQAENGTTVDGVDLGGGGGVEDVSYGSGTAGDMNYGSGVTVGDVSLYGSGEVSSGSASYNSSWSWGGNATIAGDEEASLPHVSLTLEMAVAQSVAAIAICVIALGLHNWARPFPYRFQNHMDGWLFAADIIVIGLGIVYTLVAVHMPETIDDSALGLALEVAMLIVLIGSVLGGIGFLGVRCWRQWRHARKRALIACRNAESDAEGETGDAFGEYRLDRSSRRESRSARWSRRASTLPALDCNAYDSNMTTIDEGESTSGSTHQAALDRPIAQQKYSSSVRRLQAALLPRHTSPPPRVELHQSVERV